MIQQDYGLLVASRVLNCVNESIFLHKLKYRAFRKYLKRRLFLYITEKNVAKQVFSDFSEALPVACCLLIQGRVLFGCSYPPAIIWVLLVVLLCGS